MQRSTAPPSPTRPSARPPLRNNKGKTALVDLLILITLPDSEEGELAAGAMSQLVAERLEGEQGVEEAVAAGAFRRVVNPAPRDHTDHLRMARAAYQGYYRNNRADFGYSVLLAIGSRSGSTTQAELRIFYDGVVACCIVPRTLEELHEMVADILLVRAA